MSCVPPNRAMVNFGYMFARAAPINALVAKACALGRGDIRSPAQHVARHGARAAGKRHRGRFGREAIAGGGLAGERGDRVHQRRAPQRKVGRLRLHVFKLRFRALGVDGRRDLGGQTLLRQIERGLIELDGVGEQLGLRVEAPEIYIIARECGVKSKPRVRESVAGGLQRSLWRL